MKIDEKFEISLISSINSRTEDKASSFFEAQRIQSRESQTSNENREKE
jgi:hypothetical protein